MFAKQTKFDWFDNSLEIYSPEVSAALKKLSTEGKKEARGAIFTRSEVVNFILDLVGYTTEHPLHEKTILEPSFGMGDFLLPIIERLLESWKSSKTELSVVDALKNAIRAVELHHETFIATRELVIQRLIKEEISKEAASLLADHWLIEGDFLLEDLEMFFDFVVGNPPYVRQELIPSALLALYRSRYQTLFDRADLYIPFIEKSLLLLAKGGELGFICPDRWTKNRYGGPLRNLVANQFHLKVYVDMIDTQAFQSDVSAYPVIVVIANEKDGGSTRVAYCPAINKKQLTALAKNLQNNDLPQKDSSVREIAQVTNKSDPWLIGATDQMELLRRLEKSLPTLEENDCKVGIGVATGADKAFIGNFEKLDVEADRKLPLATTKDIQSGEIRWLGQGVINPFHEDGTLVKLSEYPRLEKYLVARYEVIANRHCAKKAPRDWYRTIDRITPSLAHEPKLLIPDIKGSAHIVFESGHLYPHHNLYYITSKTWDLYALQAVLLSSVTTLFISSYSTKMRGGYLRFQAQYLRRIRLPNWNDISETLRQELIVAARNKDLRACNKAVFDLYGLTQSERTIIGGNGE